MRFNMVGLREVDDLWPLALPFIEKACARPEHNGELYPGELWTDCRSGQAFMFAAYDVDPFDLHMVTIWRFERETDLIFRCVILGGKNMRGWRELARDGITKFAADGGASEMVFRGRSGWMRLFGAQADGPDMKVIV